MKAIVPPALVSVIHFKGAQQPPGRFNVLPKIEPVGSPKGILNELDELERGGSEVGSRKNSHSALSCSNNQSQLSAFNFTAT